MTSIIDLLKSNTDIFGVAAVSAIVSAAVSYLFKRRETRHAAEVEYEYEQRKKLIELIGRHHGRLLNAANSMNFRMWNLYTNHDKNWLDANGNYADPAFYYFRSTVYRFLNVCALVRVLETEAVMLDARIAPEKDFVFLNYVAAFHWVMTDTALMDGLPYDDFKQTDHFFSDHLRQYCDLCLYEGTFINQQKFSALLDGPSNLDPVLHFFDGLKRDEPRLRWDRLVAFHLLIMAFINSFGYERQYSNDDHFARAAMQICNPRVLENLINWIPRHDLDRDRETKKIIRAAKGLAQQQLPADGASRRR